MVAAGCVLLAVVLSCFLAWWRSSAHTLRGPLACRAMLVVWAMERGGMVSKAVHFELSGDVGVRLVASRAIAKEALLLHVPTNIVLGREPWEDKAWLSTSRAQPPDRRAVWRVQLAAKLSSGALRDDPRAQCLNFSGAEQMHPQLRTAQELAMLNGSAERSTPDVRHSIFACGRASRLHTHTPHAW